MNKPNNKIRELNSTKPLTDLSIKMSFPKHLEGWPSVLSLKKGGDYRILIFQVTEHIFQSKNTNCFCTRSCHHSCYHYLQSWPTSCTISLAHNVPENLDNENSGERHQSNSSGGLHLLYQVAAWPHKYKVWRLLGIWFYKCYQFPWGTFNQTAGA